MDFSPVKRTAVAQKPIMTNVPAIYFCHIDMSRGKSPEAIGFGPPFAISRLLPATSHIQSYRFASDSGKYYESVQSLARYLVSKCTVDGYINLSRAHGSGTTDTITFVYDQNQWWATGHFVGNGERDGEWRTRALFKRRERTAVDYISSLLREIASEGHLFVAVNCKTYIDPRPADDPGHPMSCLRRTDAWAEKRAAFVGEAQVLRSMGAQVPAAVPAGELAVVQIDPQSLRMWRGAGESKLCW